MAAIRFIQPCSPIRAKEAPAGDGWLHELKIDGYRVQVHKVGSRVVICSRNGHDFTERFPPSRNCCAGCQPKRPCAMARLSPALPTDDGLSLLRVADKRGLEANPERWQ